MFTNDYSGLAHPKVLEALLKAQNEENIAYGKDVHSDNAKKLINKTFCCQADIHFLTGGTQTNLVFISYCLKPYEAALAVETGHINVHETAAVEGTGHKIYTVTGKDGKIYPNDINKALEINKDEHMCKIKLVYISNSTEIGTIYSKKELKDLYACCKKNNLYLFIDGARLGTALTSSQNDCKPSDIAANCDAFYIGGTKNGMLFGEALVIVNKSLQTDFRYHIKNRGAMLAKGFVPGIMFETMFTDNLYFNVAKQTNLYAEQIYEVLKKKKYKVLPAPTNQIFVTLDHKKAAFFINKYGCELWNKDEKESTIRIVTSFITTSNEVEQLISDF